MRTLPRLLLFIALALPACAQTTYVQTTRTCGVVSCFNAQFIPTGSLSYNIVNTCKVMGCSFYDGSVTWNGVEYSDFTGKMLWLGYGNHYPKSNWRIQGTFGAGANTITEDFECYHGCDPQKSNTSGTVTTP